MARNEVKVHPVVVRNRTECTFFLLRTQVKFGGVPKRLISDKLKSILPQSIGGERAAGGPEGSKETN
jgi:hypothetical protein